MSPIHAEQLHIHFQPYVYLWNILRPTASEISLLQTCKAYDPTLSREAKMLMMEKFVAIGSRVRRIRRPWLRVCSKYDKELSPLEGVVIPEKSLIVIGSCSWSALIHEWYHWILGERYGWELSATVEADVCAEAFSRAVMMVLRPDCPEVNDVRQMVQELTPQMKNLVLLVDSESTSVESKVTLMTCLYFWTLDLIKVSTAETKSNVSSKIKRSSSHAFRNPDNLQPDLIGDLSDYDLWIDTGDLYPKARAGTRSETPRE